MEQIVLYGKEGLETIIRQQEINHIFLVCGKSSYEQSGAAEFIRALPVHSERFSDFSPNPKYEEICRGLAAFKASRSKVILAVGGGSSIDVAKCIRLYASMDETKPFYLQEGCDTDVLLLAVPTTAGSGSESTSHAVMYREGTKQSISRSYLRPAYAILEPEFLYSLPIKQKKSTLLDALCQGIESYWAKGATKESRIYATESIRMIAKYWKSYVFEDCRYREIMYAANLSGKAIHISRTTAPHALSYGLTSLYGINHGYAAALCMEQVWKYMLEQADKAKDSHTKMAESLTCCLNSISAIMPYQGFCKIMNALEMEKPLSKDKEGDIAILAGKVNVERLGNHPIVLDKRTIVNFYERIVKQVED